MLTIKTTQSLDYTHSLEYANCLDYSALGIYPLQYILPKCSTLPLHIICNSTITSAPGHEHG